MIEAIKNSVATESNLLQLKKACRGFEAILVDKMLEEMDRSLPKDPWVKNNAQNSIYKSMYFDALSRKIAKDSPFGVGNMLFSTLKDYVEYKKNVKNFHKVNIKPFAQKSLKMIELPKRINIEPIERDVKFVESSLSNKFNANGKIKNTVEKAARRYNVPKKLIYSIIKAESDFNPNVISKAGAIGLMQLMPQTALELGVKNIWNIEENVMGGTKYIASLLKQFKNEKLAIAAYNAGPGNVKKYKGIPPFKETQNYVKKVLAYIDGKY